MDGFLLRANIESFIETIITPTAFLMRASIYGRSGEAG